MHSRLFDRARQVSGESRTLTSIAALFVIGVGALASHSGHSKQVWILDDRDGSYTNPIIFGDYSDPDAIRVGDDFYMTASSFNCSPGLPALHSRDLVNWTIIGNALQQLKPEDIFNKPQHGAGVWAPAIRHRDGEFYIYCPRATTSIFAPAGGVAIGWQTALRSKNIFGPYEDRIVMDKGETGINGPHQVAWVELKSDESWFIHFHDRGPYGRVVHLQPMKWINDWPVIGVDGSERRLDCFVWEAQG